MAVYLRCYLCRSNSNALRAETSARFNLTITEHWQELNKTHQRRKKLISGIPSAMKYSFRVFMRHRCVEETPGEGSAHFSQFAHVDPVSDTQHILLSYSQWSDNPVSSISTTFTKAWFYISVIWSLNMFYPFRRGSAQHFSWEQKLKMSLIRFISHWTLTALVLTSFIKDTNTFIQMLYIYKYRSEISLYSCS